MKVLITGASGYIGNKLAHTLAGMGMDVHALARSAEAKHLLQHPNIKVFNGDILQKESLIAAMHGCRQVYHLAAKVGVWAAKPSVFYDVNVEGTRNVLNAALQAGAEKIVVTGTCGVIGPSYNEPLDENAERSIGYQIDYDFSKKNAEDLILQYADKGLNALIVSPSKVYGPGNVSHSLTTNAIINSFLKKQIGFIPYPGDYKVCFAYLDDVVAGHISAMEKGRSGEKYILGGINISYRDFFRLIRSLSSQKGYIISLPKPVIKTWAYLQELNYKLRGSRVRFPAKSVGHLYSNYTFSSRKAIEELNYTITPMEEGLTKTIHFLKHQAHD